MNWIIVATIAYFLFALASITDKFIVSKKLNPAVYTFFIATVSGLISIILIPFGFSWLGYKLLIIDLFSGFSFMVALFLLFNALEKKETTRIFTTVGGLQPIIILFFAYLFLNEKLSLFSLLGLMIIVSGTFLISFVKGKGKIGKPAIYFVLISAVFFAISFTLEKYVYLNHTFISGFIWNRFGNLLAALALFLHTPTRKKVFLAVRSKPAAGEKRNTLKVFIFGQTAGGIGAFLQRYAISLGSVSLVSAMQGTQYAFLLILTSFLTIKFPKILKETISRRILIQKIIAILLIGLGLTLLTIK